MVALRDLERLLKREPASADWVVAVTGYPPGAKEWLVLMVQRSRKLTAEEALATREPLPPEPVYTLHAVHGAAVADQGRRAEGLAEMSPTLLNKYLAAAKDLADHAVLLPDGFRFLTGKTRRDWINEAGLFSMHVPIEDMTPPSQEQIDQVIAGIDKAIANKLGVAIHCGAGLGRTGTLVACWLVAKHALAAKDAMARVRRLRP